MRIGALFAQPFMPAKAAEMLDILGVKDTRRSLRFALWGADNSYGVEKQSDIPYVFPRLGKAPEGESMEELRMRRRAEKNAQKEKDRQERMKRAAEELFQATGQTLRST